MSRTPDIIVGRQCYEPLAPQLREGRTIDPVRCQHRVPDNPGVGFSQCSRKPVETIEGHGFCRQHAAKVRQALAREATQP